MNVIPAEQVHLTGMDSSMGCGGLMKSSDALERRL
jgi:hypothetical protein